jgi:hypothetical protein
MMLPDDNTDLPATKMILHAKEEVCKIAKDFCKETKQFYM